MNREFSAGGIVFNQAGKVLLTQSSSKLTWGFPKGNIEKGEKGADAALREVREEAGVVAEIVQKIGDSKYVYTHPESKEKVFKIVALFLMDYISGDIVDHDWEVEEVVWLEPEQALKQLSFSQDKTLLKKALEIKSGAK
ncbi:NUDIX domain-containing protein [Patescibacteria group bacterium]|nr:NUDIX domain-containing protein [Patescibacteria group bacterium]MCL5410168.1 NUDIX domain-containing protein [Patescibacteria group bacterium]